MTERRHSDRNLTPLDVKDIAEALKNIHQKTSCRFLEISQEDLKETIRFCKHFNSVKQNSIKVIWNTFLILGATGLVSIIVLGIVEKIKSIKISM